MSLTNSFDSDSGVSITVVGYYPFGCQGAVIALRTIYLFHQAYEKLVVSDMNEPVNQWLLDIGVNIFVSYYV